MTRCEPFRQRLAGAVLLSSALLSGAAHAQIDEGVLGDRFRERVTGALSVMGLIAVPDVAASSLTISDQSTDDTELLLWQLGDGFTLSDDLPIFLEGYLGYARYDPTFVVTSGTDESPFAVGWNVISATVGMGYSLPITDTLQLRPIANLSFGHIESDLSLAGRILEEQAGLDFAFLDGGRMNAIGYGGSLVLDYRRWTPAYELDVELRYTHLLLEPVDSTSLATQFGADAITASLWARYRWPTGWTLLGQPMRYVLDAAHTTYFGDSEDALGFNHLTRVGAGLEMEVGDFALLTDRLRIMGRVLFGENAYGFSASLGISF